MIHEITGDATRPKPSDTDKCIIHICNDVGAWGAGFVTAVSRRWIEPEYVYLTSEHELGDVQIVPVQSDDERSLWVINMIAQSGLRSPSNPVPLKYPVLSEALGRVEKFLSDHQKLTKTPISLHLPRIGSGLAGGDWEKIKKMIAHTFKNYEVYIYSL